MVQTPNASASGKRNQSVSASHQNKRRRLDDGQNEAYLSPSREQQTLTQAQWVQKPPRRVSGHYNTSPTGIKREWVSDGWSSSGKKSRNSTLTQMNFFTPPDHDPIDFEELMTPIGISTVEGNIAQLDGPAEATRGALRRKTQEKNKLTISLEEAGADKAAKGSKLKRRKTLEAREDGVPKSTSNRQRSKVAVDQKVGGKHDNQKKNIARNNDVGSPMLEIPDSIDTNHDVENVLLEGAQISPFRLPQTPEKQRRVVPSSQSPESLLPSTQRKRVQFSDNIGLERSPLKERSVNVSGHRNRREMKPPSTYVTLSPEKKLQPSQSSQHKQWRFSGVVQDSQAPDWAIEDLQTLETDPARIDVQSQKATSPFIQTENWNGNSESRSTEALSNPSTDKIKTANMQDEKHIEEEVSVVTEKQTQSPPILNDVNNKISTSLQGLSTQGANDPLLLDEDAPSAGANDEDNNAETISQSPAESSLSEFGSPIANDTQFNVELLKRTSSPMSDDVEQNSEPTGSTPDEEQTNQIISSSSPLASDRQATSKQVPLNDVASSPPASSASGNKTPRSIYPASLPHQSQISTQEATQGYLSSPLMETVASVKPERISIKDSSSIPIPWSQIQPYNGNDNTQKKTQNGLDKLIFSDNDDEDEMDLNPPSSPRLPPRVTNLDACEEESNISSPVKSKNISRIPAESDQHRDSQKRHLDLAIPSPSASEPDLVPSDPITPKPRLYSPIPGFNNDTQSNFTQNGHVTAAYIHRQREAGVLPDWYTPKPYQVPGYRRGY